MRGGFLQGKEQFKIYTKIYHMQLLRTLQVEIFMLIHIN